MRAPAAGSGPTPRARAMPSSTIPPSSMQVIRKSSARNMPSCSAASRRSMCWAGAAAPTIGMWNASRLLAAVIHQASSLHRQAPRPAWFETRTSSAPHHEENVPDPEGGAVKPFSKGEACLRHRSDRCGRSPSGRRRSRAHRRSRPRSRARPKSRSSRDSRRSSRDDRSAPAASVRERKSARPGQFTRRSAIVVAALARQPVRRRCSSRTPDVAPRIAFGGSRLPSWTGHR